MARLTSTRIATIRLPFGPSDLLFRTLPSATTDSAFESLLARWAASGAAERANFQASSTSSASYSRSSVPSPPVPMTPPTASSSAT